MRQFINNNELSLPMPMQDRHRSTGIDACIQKNLSCLDLVISIEKEGMPITIKKKKRGVNVQILQ